MKKNLFRRVIRFLRFRTRKNEQPTSCEFSGDFDNWDSARKSSTGYDDEQIAKKVYKSTIDVLEGKFSFERDSVAFSQPEYNWPVLSCLLHSIDSRANQPHIVDFGGALGSFFLQHRIFLCSRSNLIWEVVEQPTFCTLGKTLVEQFPVNQNLFFTTSEDLFGDYQKKTLLLSSVIQYLPDPIAELSRLLSLNFSSVIFDRTALLPSTTRCRLTVQKVPATIYAASYPAWFIGENLLQKTMTLNGYNMVADWASLDNYTLQNEQPQFKGFYFQKRSPLLPL
jgi:putative methyltransferase (TIGR04325 family)